MSETPEIVYPEDGDDEHSTESDTGYNDQDCDWSLGERMP